MDGNDGLNLGLPMELTMAAGKEEYLFCGTITKGGAGFTLVELMTVLVIIATLITLSVPAYVTWIPGFRLKGAALDLYGNLQAAKILAIRDGREHAVVFDVAKDAYRLMDGGPDGDFGSGGDDAPLVPDVSVRFSEYGNGVGLGAGNAEKSATNPPGPLPMDFVTLSGNRVVFDSRGMCPGYNGFIYLQADGGRSYAVGILQTGIVRLRRWRGDAWR